MRDQRSGLRPSKQGTVIVRAWYMSMGVNLLTPVDKRIVGPALDADFDIDGVSRRNPQPESRTRPSGTRLMLGEAAAEARCCVADVLNRGAATVSRVAPQARQIGFTADRGGRTSSAKH